MPGPRKNPPDQRVADILGCSRSLISHYRTGRQTPGWDMMENIERRFNWSFEDQVTAKRTGSYRTEFENVLRSWVRR